MIRVGSMVIYPKETKFPDERKHLIIMGVPDAPKECFTLDYEHHYWIDPKYGDRCLCGKEVYEGE